jgi:hypothetical protein
VNARWRSFVEARGARVEHGVVQDFGAADDERRAAAASSVMADLSHLGILEFTGTDRETFLQGQLSCDVKALQRGGATLGSYCTPKGRMLASFVLISAGDALLMLPSRALVDGLRKRLQMYVMRSKVTIRDLSDERVLIGFAGEHAAAQIEKARAAGAVTVAPLADGRFMVVAEPQMAETIWTDVSAALRPVGTPCWEWLDIRQGIPLVTEPTREQLVPQMANLELVGGVSFTKGCYPGQEIVARSHYLGKVKRRMRLAHVDSVAAAGDPVFSEQLGDQASGLVVNAEPSPEGGYDLLAVTQASDEGKVHLKSLDGPLLRFMPLPYSVD